ncbi:MAG: NAD(P)H-hydrate dehydratase [Gloeomargaritaceae cyanobacterium C42_A2020_066]|nr:NAD(P)H-hydrate dehydratase [Gloeomargaritaceae cyanobacterium C42_A2020_066]
MTGQDWADQVVVTAAQMQAIEASLFAQGLPVPALMEKAAGRAAAWIQAHYPRARYPQVGVLVGPGHNGGDALVVARELHHGGYHVCLHQPLEQAKPLTEGHRRYADYLGIPAVGQAEALMDCDLIVDGLLGVGLDRPVENPLAAVIDAVNASGRPAVSLDVPSGLHSNTGQVLGSALRARHTLCLGLWKVGLLQDAALDWVGEPVLLPLNIPEVTLAQVLGNAPMRCLTREQMLAALPLPRRPAGHKYQMGHLLLVAGSRQYGGAALLAALGARASGVGMLSVAVPAGLAGLVLAQVPEALVISCPETPEGAIAHLPPDLDFGRYDALAVGPGLTVAAGPILASLWATSVPLVVDADALNSIAPWAQSPRAQVFLTPHPGEFSRLFPDLDLTDRFQATRQAAGRSQATVLLKGARLVIAGADGSLAVNPTSTPGLARGGSGDVLTGLLGGLLAQGHRQGRLLIPLAQAAAWWHAQAGRWVAHHRTELGVDPLHLSQSLLPTLKALSEGEC